MISSQKTNNIINAPFSSGMEMIWYFEDAYEQKDLNKFFSLVSLDFKKDFLKFMRQLKKRFEENEQISLYIHLIAKKQDLVSGIYSYGICWSKRIKPQESDYWRRDYGKAIIILKKRNNMDSQNLLLYDICGDNPFC